MLDIRFIENAKQMVIKKNTLFLNSQFNLHRIKFFKRKTVRHIYIIYVIIYIILLHIYIKILTE
jgi:hypothetical protein